MKTRRDFLEGICYLPLLFCCSRANFTSQEGIYENAAYAVLEDGDWDYIIRTIDTRDLGKDKGRTMDFLTDVFWRLPVSSLQVIVNTSISRMPVLKTIPGISNDPRTYIVAIAARKANRNDPLIISRRTLTENPSITQYVDIGKGYIEIN